MFVSENAVVKLLKIVMWVFGFCYAEAKRSSEIYCGACIAMVDEVNYKISTADKKSTVQIGSFRIDSHGNQKLHEIPFARSELHLTELLEDVCNRMSDYAESLSSNGNRNFIRISTADGSGMQQFKLDKVQISASIQSQLKFACETLIEEHEETLIEAFQGTEDSVDNNLCVSVIEVCKSNNITDRQQVMDDVMSAATLQQTDEDTTDEARAAAAAAASDSDEQQSTDDHTKEDL